MTRLADAVHALAVTLWAGALWVIGLLTAPVLFQMIADRTLAGSIAGRLFLYVALIGMACGLYLLVFRLARFGTHAVRQGFFWVVVLLLVLTLIGQFGVQPILTALKQQAGAQAVMESVFRERFATWHGVASVLYIVQCVLALPLVLLQGR
jgi:uncharacterized membrane protein